MSTPPQVDSPATLPGWHMPWPDFAVDWSRAALVVVDMQNYGCNPSAGVAAMPMARPRLERNQRATSVEGATAPQTHRPGAMRTP